MKRQFVWCAAVIAVGCVGDNVDSNVGALDSVPLPRKIAPLHAALVGTTEPWFRVEGDVVAGTRLDICRDRTCTVVEQSVAMWGQEHVRVIGSLYPGRYFWRISRGGRATEAWAFYVPPRWGSRTTATAYNADFNGDGLPEFASNAMVAGVGVRVHVQQRPRIEWENPVYRVLGVAPGHPMGDDITNLGDVNADGYSDMALTQRGTDGTTEPTPTRIFHGSPEGPVVPAGTLPAFARVRGAGDVNRDGYGDVLVEGGATTSLHLGSINGILATPARSWSAIVRAVGDTNGDGYADLLSQALPLTVYLGGTDLATMDTRAVSTTRALSLPSSDRSRNGWGDFNADGFSDLVTLGADYVAVHLSSTSGYRETPDSVLRLPFTERPDNESTIRSAMTVDPISVGDITGDGHTDIVFCGAATQVYDDGAPSRAVHACWITTGRGGGVWEPPVLRGSFELSPIWYVRVGDLNRDERDDLLRVAREESFVNSPGYNFPVSGYQSLNVAPFGSF